MQKTGETRAHALEVTGRARAVITGVSEVLSFDENAVMLLTSAGDMTVVGEGLRVAKLALSEGQLIVEGQISGVQYEQGRARVKENVLRRMFK